MSEDLKLAEATARLETRVGQALQRNPNARALDVNLEDLCVVLASRPIPLSQARGGEGVTDAMIEAAAEAMFDDARARSSRPYDDWLASPEYTREAWRHAARAAIPALSVTDGPTLTYDEEHTSDVLRKAYAYGYGDGFVDHAFPEGSADDGEGLRTEIDPMAIVEGFEAVKDSLFAMIAAAPGLAPPATDEEEVRDYDIAYLQHAADVLNDPAVHWKDVFDDVDRCKLADGLIALILKVGGGEGSSRELSQPITAGLERGEP